MTKEYLEAFKNLKQELYYSPNQIPDVDKWHETIEQALQRLEQIDNAKPNEALKSFDYIAQSLEALDDIAYMDCIEHLTTIKQTLLKAQEMKEDIIHYKGTIDNLRRDNALLKDIKNEQEEVLEIIKNKCLYTDNLNEVATCLNYNYYKERISKKYDTEVVKTDWNDKALLDYLKLLTEEEFNLVKRYCDRKESE